ncbi:MAG TPA: hypothetical protein VGV60_07340 [Candidatus Polarisedimenticolia bacterium]|jgi:hypothetical protein|nr:hypothetical protein [Candidatus Polarisedimenticolia bacterium]
MEGRCIWCNKVGGNLRQATVGARHPLLCGSAQTEFVVHEEHADAFRRLSERVGRSGWLFLAAIGVCLLAMVALEIALVAGARTVGIVGIGVAVVALGIVLSALPFSTPQTVALLGARTAARLVRVAGALLIGLGLFVALLAR